MKKRLTAKYLKSIIEAAGFTVTLEKSFCNTDRKVGRLRIPGNGRTGARIKVYDSKENLLLDHDNAETYRNLSEVANWMKSNGIKLPD